MSSRRSPDLDVVKARRLAYLLTKLADKLESPRAELEAQIDPERYDPKAQTDLVLASARTTIQRLHDAWRRVDASGANELDGQRRELLLDTCSTMGQAIRTLKGEGRPSNFEDTLIDMGIGIYADDVPEHRAALVKHRNLAADLIRAHARVKGTPSVAEAAEALCKAMGFPARYGSAKRVARRRRQRDGKR